MLLTIEFDRLLRMWRSSTEFRDAALLLQQGYRCLYRPVAFFDLARCTGVDSLPNPGEFELRFKNGLLRLRAESYDARNKWLQAIDGTQKRSTKLPIDEPRVAHVEELLANAAEQSPQDLLGRLYQLYAKQAATAGLRLQEAGATLMIHEVQKAKRALFTKRIGDAQRRLRLEGKSMASSPYREEAEAILARIDDVFVHAPEIASACKAWPHGLSYEVFLCNVASPLPVHRSKHVANFVWDPNLGQEEEMRRLNCETILRAAALPKRKQALEKWTDEVFAGLDVVQGISGAVVDAGAGAHAGLMQGDIFRHANALLNKR